MTTAEPVKQPPEKKLETMKLLPKTETKSRYKTCFNKKFVLYSVLLKQPWLGFYSKQTHAKAFGEKILLERERMYKQYMCINIDHIRNSQALNTSNMRIYHARNVPKLFRSTRTLIVKKVS
jgi:hypothetical protein